MVAATANSSFSRACSFSRAHCMGSTAARFFAGALPRNGEGVSPNWAGLPLRWHGGGGAGMGCLDVGIAGRLAGVRTLAGPNTGPKEMGWPTGFGTALGGAEPSGVGGNRTKPGNTNGSGFVSRSPGHCSSPKSGRSAEDCDMVFQTLPQHKNGLEMSEGMLPCRQQGFGFQSTQSDFSSPCGLVVLVCSQEKRGYFFIPRAFNNTRNKASNDYAGNAKHRD